MLVGVNSLNWRTFGLWCLILGVLCAPCTLASYITSPWETQVLQADFIGIVECEIAGSPVAGFRVVESWQGPKPGTKITLSISTGQHGDSFDGALCGERFLLMAGRVRERAEASSPDPYLAPDPSRGWQGLPIDYGVSFSMAKLPLHSFSEEDDPRPLSSFGSRRRTIEAFKQDVLGLLSASQEERALRRLKRVFADALAMSYLDEESEGVQLREPMLTHVKWVQSAASVDEMVARLLAFRPKVDQNWGNVVSRVLEECGLPALRQVLSIRPEDFPSRALEQYLILYSLLRAPPAKEVPAEWYPRVTPEDEVRTLKTLTERLADWEPNQRYSLRDRHELLLLRRRVSTLKAPEDIAGCLVEAAAKPGELQSPLRHVLFSGAQATLRVLEQAEAAEPNGTDRWHRETIRGIQRRLGLPLSPEHPLPHRFRRLEAPTAADLNEWRRLLADPVSASHSMSEAIAGLARFDPDAVVAFLLRRAEGVRLSLGPPDTFATVPFFSSKCVTNREPHLHRLMSASHPAIRVGAAVSLCFDNRASGLEALRGTTNLAGEAGTWAAVTLARWGEKEAVERALHGVFDSEPAYHDGPFRGYLRWQLLALLSNSAKASRLPQPKEPYAKWWNQYAERITLADPWLDRYRGKK
jgi:hypothetical protein